MLPDGVRSHRDFHHLVKEFRSEIRPVLPHDRVPFRVHAETLKGSPVAKWLELRAVNWL